MAADALSIIPSAVLRNLSDKLYEKRKNAALEVRGLRSLRGFGFLVISAI
jgi:vacuole morphology and inheritance protein 14